MALAVVSAAPAFAEEAPATASEAVLREGKIVFSSDGKRVGRIDRVVGDKGAAPTAVTVIKDMQIVSIPASSLSNDDKGRLVTTLALKQIR